MSFNEFLNQAWRDHASNPKLVADRLEEGARLMTSNEQIVSLGNLITHVMGEHLGEWGRGIQLLEKLKVHPLFESASESQKALSRFIACLEMASGKRQSVDDLSISDQVRVLALSTSALCEQKAPSKALEYFSTAIEKARTGISKDDPANRALAVAGNNLACALEERPDRTEIETELMILAARTGRQFWEIAGTWLETERAEYRLAKSYLAAKKSDLAHKHALSCIEISQKNNAPSLELFFGFEALCLVEKARENTTDFKNAIKQAELNFSQLSSDDKIWCEEILKNLRGLG